MRELNTATMGSSSGKVVYPRSSTFPQGHRCSRLRQEWVIPFQNNTGGAANLTLANLVSALQAVLASILLKFGVRAPETVDNAISFDQMREQCIAMSGHDFLVYIAGVATELQAVAGNVITALANAGTQSVTVELVRPFAVERLGEVSGNHFAPGWSQMNQLIWENNRGSGFAPANWAQNGNINITYIADTVEAKDDVWAVVPRLYFSDETGRVQKGPNGLLLALWERSAVGASTALTQFSIKRADDAPVHELVKASRVVADSLQLKPPGTYDLNNLQTVLFHQPEGTKLEDVPCGSGWLFEQPNNDLQPAHTAWLHVPPVTEDTARQIASCLTDSSLPGNMSVVALANLSTWNDGPDIHEHVASYSPVVVLRPGNSDFAGVPASKVYSDSGEERLYINPKNQSISIARVAASKDGARSSAALDEAANLAKWVPGFSSPKRAQPAIGSIRLIGARLGVQDALKV